jgi:uncharacterized protein YjiS (DUF1127 family)
MILSEHSGDINPVAPELEDPAVDAQAAALSTSARADGVALPRSSHWRPEMSATLSTIARPAGTRSPGAGLWILNACLEKIARYFVRRAAIASLRELDDCELRDIGLARSQIEAAVDGLMTAPTRGRG